MRTSLLPHDDVSGVRSSSSSLDPNYLAPRDVFTSSAASAALSARQRSSRSRSADRRRKPQFKKLLWFKQPCACTYLNSYSTKSKSQADGKDDQFRTTTPTRKRSWTTCSGTRACGRTSSGRL